MNRSASPLIALTRRDIAIVSMVDAYGGCTVSQLRRRFFPTPGARSACYARIARLITGGYLGSVRLPAFTGIGSGKVLLTAGRAARALLLKQSTSIARQMRPSSRLVAPLFVHHHLAIGDFRLTLELACKTADTYSLAEWTSEHELRRAPLRVQDPETGATIPLIADGAFILTRADGATQPLLLELDMGTLSPKRLRLKLGYYAILGRDCPSSAAPILFVVPDERRRQSLAAWAQQEAQQLSGDPTIFWITTHDRIDERTILSSPIWQIAGGPPGWSLAGEASPPAMPAVAAVAGTQPPAGLVGERRVLFGASGGGLR